MKQGRLVSIIMNCYNGEKYLREAIDSVISQTYQKWELIFWDNQSTDNCADIFKSYGDSRLKYYYADQHTDIYIARNYAIQKSKGDFISFLDVDDKWSTDKLERQIPLFSDLGVGIVCGNYWIKNEKKKKCWKALKNKIPSGWVLDELLKSYYVALVTLVVRRTAFSGSAHPCDERYHIIGDFDLVIRLSVNWKLACIDDPIAILRLHENNESNKNRNRHTDEVGFWINEIESGSLIKDSESWNCFKYKYEYLKGINEVIGGNRKSAFYLFIKLPWGGWKLRLLVALVLPIYVVRFIKN